jgi:hypothetical protein
MKLIAVFAEESCEEIDPKSVRWEDGTAATLDDYHKHLVDTHIFWQNDAGELEVHMCPEIPAEVAFESNVGDWVVRGPGVTTAALELRNPDATDSEINIALAGPPLVYRARINRQPASAR